MLVLVGRKVRRAVSISVASKVLPLVRPTPPKAPSCALSWSL